MSTPEEPVSAAPMRPGRTANALKLDSPLPLRQLTDWEIQLRASALARAEAAAQRIAEAEVPDGALRVAQRLADQGAAPGLVERARTAANEDRQYAREQTAKARALAERLYEQGRQAEAEMHRRQQLTPSQRQSEEAERMRSRPTAPPTHRTATGPSAFAARQPAEAVRQRGQAR